jgi:peptide/nickel transport system substrate-binding protein/oligopeptide transport system substrate-binding protein
MTTNVGSLTGKFVLLGLASVLAACGGQLASSASGGSGAAKGGTLSIAFNSDLQHLDPALAYDTTSQPAVRLLFDSLLDYDEGTKLGPALAADMPTVSADGKVYTFKLKPGIKFVKADGQALREITADDVAYSINRVLSPNLKPNPSPVESAFFGNIVGADEVIGGKAKTATGIKVIDPATIEFDLVKADRTFLNVMATTFASVVPKEFATDDTAKFDAAPIGTGPFYLKTYTKGQSAQFVRNPVFWDAGQPLLDGVDFRLSVDDDTALQQVQADQLDVMGDAIPSGSFTQVTTDPTYKDQIYHHTLVDTQFLYMDTQMPNKGPLSILKVRQAIEHAIDKDHIVQIIHGAGKPAGCIYPPDLPGYDASCNPYNYDPAKAKSLLAEAGFPNGFSTKFFTDTTDPDPQVAEAIQQDLADVGIKVQLEKQEFSTYLDTLFTPHAGPMQYIGWYQDYPDTSDFIDPILSCATTVKGGSNAAQYCNKEVDAKAAAAKGMTDEAAREAAYQEIERMIMADAPAVPIYYQERYNIVSKRTVGFAIHPVWLIDVRALSLKAGS